MTNPLRFMSVVITEFRRLGCTSLAASLAFFSLLSFFPMVFLLLYAVGLLVGQDVIGHQFLLSFLKGFLPGLGAGLANEIRRVAELEPVRWIVLLAFAWFGTLVFVEIDYTINVVFGSPRHRHPLIATAVAVALFGVIELLLIVTYAATQTIDALVAHAPRSWSIDLVAIAAHDFVLTYTLPFILSLAAVTCLYRYLPQQRPRLRDAAAGGLLFSLLWVLAKLLFIAYGEHATIYGRLYGSLLDVIILLLWVYYSASLLLFGAVIVRQLQIHTAPPSSP